LTNFKFLHIILTRQPRRTDMDIHPCKNCAQASVCNIRLAFERFGQTNPDMKSVTFSCQRFESLNRAPPDILQARTSSCRRCGEANNCRMKKNMSLLFTRYDNSISLIALFCTKRLYDLAKFLEGCLSCQRTGCPIRDALNFKLVCSYHPDR